MDVEFCDLSYQATNRLKGTKTQILKNVSGKFQPGQLCAILGPSGAGKTTLLHALSGYKTAGVSGELKCNGIVRSESHFRRRSCYITQEDQLPPWMTVEETMLMAANLKLPQKTSSKQKKAIVLDVLCNLGLAEQASTRTDKISGGQKKRLSVALELINNPPIFFLDEPTSGLDNVSSSQCLRLLRMLSKEGRTIVITIHQPSATLFQMFDQVYVVAQGRCVYRGTPQNLVPHLSSIGYDCPKSYNPADFIIELTDGDPANIVSLANAIENEPRSESTISNKVSSIKELKNKKSHDDIELNWIKLRNSPECVKITYATTGYYQFWILLQRMLLQTMRNKVALSIQALHYLTCGILLGTVYFNNANDGKQMYNHLKFCVGIVLFYSHTQIMIPVLLFPQEVKLTKKEHFNRWYSLTPYYIALTVAKLPVQIFYNMGYIVLIYFMSGLPLELWRFIMFAVIGNAVSLASEGMGLAIGSIFNVMNGSCIGPSITAPFLGLAIYGFDFAKDIHWIMKILMKTSPMRCGLVSFALITFGFGRQPLDCDDIYCHFANPKVLLEFLDISDNQLYAELLALLGIILFYRIVAYISLKKRFST